MLTIQSVSPGAVDYLLRGSDCAEHEHATPAAGRGADSGGGRGAGRTADAVGYLLTGAVKEPAGVWFGEGLAILGIEAGSAASEAQVRAVFGRLEHPTRVDVEGRPLPLGSRPRTFRSRQEREAAALAAEPDATAERRAEIKQRVFARRRKAVAYYDLTFSAEKSVSVYWAALLAAGRDAEAANVVAAHRAGVAAAMAYVERETAYVRSGYHGKTASGQSIGVYEEARGLAWIRWDHSTSRASQPHLHSHVTVLNRAETASDGVIRALASRGFAPIKQGADALYRQTYRRLLTDTNAVVFATRPDGNAKEILGFNTELLAKASARQVDVTSAQQALEQVFERERGRTPSPAERKRLHTTAWRATRQGKNHTAPRHQLATWAAPLREELDAALAATRSQAAWVARVGHPDQHGHTGRSREQLLRAAVAAAQAKYATWQVGNLADAIADEQSRTPAVTESPVELAAEVLRESDRYGIVLLSARDVGTVPRALRRRDGLCRYRAKNAARYATTGQLSIEASIVARARGLGAAALAGPRLELARGELAVAGLSTDQQAAVLQILSSGRRGDVLIGPAGAGKSRALSTLAHAWETHVGGRVVGLATSQISTQVLVEDGLHAVNTTVFLNRFTPDDRGLDRERLRKGDLVILDEANMSTTAEVDAISALVAAAGAKLVYTGDHAQLAAVGPGGILELLVRDAGATELSGIHRFVHGWERASSVRLRAGDPDVLAVYGRHGRIRGGVQEEMTDGAVRGYLADVLAGQQSLLIARDNATAAALSGQIRAELVAAGRVSPQVLGETRDGNLIGVGDWIQARRNHRGLRVEGPGMVTNREVYQVLGHHRRTGTLAVRDRRGVVAHLPPGYLRHDVTLAYAVTVHAAEGVTVDTSHAVVDRASDRAGLYVQLTRGRAANTAYVICQSDPDPHHPEQLDSTPQAVLTDILTRPTDGPVTTATAAELARRAGVEEGRSLSWLGTQWDLLTAEYGRDRATDTLLALLGPDTTQRLVEEPGYRRLLSAVRGMELAGHDPHAVLTEAVRRGSLRDAHSLADVLRFRVRLAGNAGRIPERVVRDGDWATFTAPWPGPVGDYARVLAAAATARQRELGARLAADPPEWALAASTLGAPPADPHQRGEWVRRAGIVAAYRDLHAIPDTQDSIGAAPSREREFHHALWRQALAALGHPADTLDYATATDTELRAMRDAWRRAQAWAPQFVAEDLHAARELAEDYRRDAVIWRAGLNRHHDGSPERELAERDLAAAEHLAAVWAARVAALERVQAVRTDWVDRTRELHERATFAGDELERRGLDRDTAAPPAEQQQLFSLTDPGPTTARAEATGRRRGDRNIDPAQQQFEFNGVPRAAAPRTPADRDAAHEATAPATSSAPTSDSARAADRPVSRATTGTDTVELVAAGGDTDRAASGRAVDDDQAGASAAPQTVPDGYAAMFADTKRAAARDREQPALFQTQPAPADIAAAHPLHTDTANDAATDGRGGATGTQHAEGHDSAITVAQATRQAEIIAQLRAELDARTAAATGPARRRDANLDANLNVDLNADLNVGVDTSRDEDQPRTEQLTQGQGLST